MRLLRLLPGIGNNTAFRIFNVFQDQQAIRLTKDNDSLQRLIPKKAINSWVVLQECFQKMFEEKISPSNMIGIIYNDFYRPDNTERLMPLWKIGEEQSIFYFGDRRHEGRLHSITAFLWQKNPFQLSCFR